MCDENTIRLEPAGHRHGPGLADSLKGKGLLPVTERDVSIDTTAGLADAVLHSPRGEGRWSAILIWSDIVRLRPAFRATAGQIAALGYVVQTPMPYNRMRPAPVAGPDFSFANPAHREVICALRATLSDEAVDLDSRSFIRFLDTQAMTDTSRKAGVHGYCLGGAFAICTAVAVPDRVGAAASFHGDGFFRRQRLQRCPP